MHYNYGVSYSRPGEGQFKMRRVWNFRQRAVCGLGKEMRSTAVCFANSVWHGRRKVLFGAGERCVAWAVFFHNFLWRSGWD